MLNKFEAFVIQAGERVLAYLKWIGYVNSLVAVILLIYRYGFFLTPEETAQIFRRIDVQFLVYILIFVARVSFTPNRLLFLRGHWFQVLLYSSITLHGSVNYLFGIKLSLLAFEALEMSEPVLSNQHFMSTYLVIMVGMVITEVSTKISELQIKPATTFILSFILLILMGTGLLMLPAMTQGYESMNFLDALFTSASASCVTGLAVVDTGTFFTMKGHLVILFLIQLGGLGIVSFATFFATFLAKGVGLKHQSIIQDFLSSESLSGAKGLLRQIVFLTLLIESLGFIAIYFAWDDDLGEADKFASTGERVFYSLFHSVSAFCNAGFSLFTDGLYNNDTDKQIRKMYLVHFIIALLIIFGSMGFSTITDAFSPKLIRERIRHPWKKWKIGTKISIQYSMILLLVGTVGYMVLEFDKLTDRTIIEALITSFFQSTVTRTAGFNTMDFGTMKDATIIMTLFLMFIGGSPGSTAGGLKVNTFVLVTLSSYGSIRGQKNITIGKRNIPTDLVSKAFSILMFSVTYNTLAIFFLSLTESDKEILTLVFEQVSAFATVGISMGITGDLSTLGKIIIIISMFVGRVGTLTLALALSKSVKTNSFRYPDAHFMVG